MCRRNFLLSCILIAIGIGLVLSLFIESSLIRFLIGMGLIVTGLFFRKRC